MTFHTTLSQHPVRTNLTGGITDATKTVCVYHSRDSPADAHGDGLCLCSTGTAGPTAAYRLAAIARHYIIGSIVYNSSGSTAAADGKIIPTTATPTACYATAAKSADAASGAAEEIG